MTIVFHGRVYTAGANARLDFNVAGGCLGDTLPYDDGTAVTLSGTYNNITTTGPFTFTTTSTLPMMVEVSANVWATAGGVLTTMDFELWATVITQT